VASDYYDERPERDAYGPLPGEDVRPEPEGEVGRQLAWHELPSEQRAVIERRAWTRATVLFLLTLFSTFYVGSYMSNDPSAGGTRHLLDGWIFALPLLAILLAHEFGHYLFARWHGVATSPPYFIPFPNLFGTMGAFIAIRSPIHNRRQLLDIGAAGPLAGLVPSVVLLAIGYSLSTVTSLSSLPAGELLVFGDSLLTRFVQNAVLGPLPSGYDVMIHPVGLAGWVGLFVTMLNLIPIGSLDGGHVTYALFGRSQWRIAPAALLGVLLLGVFVEGWWLYIIGFLLVLYIVFAMVSRILSRSRRPRGRILSLGFLRHFPVTNEEPLDPVRAAVAWFCLLVLLLTFLPAPIRIM